MRRLAFAATLLGLVGGPLFADPATEKAFLEVALEDQDGVPKTLAAFDKDPILVVVFVSVDCPLANQYLADLCRLEDQDQGRGIRVVAVYSNASESRERMAKHRREFNVTVATWRDAEQKLAVALGAERTPEVFVFDDKRQLRYRGRIDDRYGYAHRRDRAHRDDLKLALDEVFTGKPVTVARTEPIGCLIEWRRGSSVNGSTTYTRDVARIVQQKCEGCHRPGMAAPFALSSFEDVSRWAGPIREAVAAGRMPPWHADASSGPFANDRRLNEHERRTLLRWLEGPMAKGDDADLPPPRDYPHGWSIGEPDTILTMPREVKIPATGVVPYKYFRMASGLKEDLWIQAAEIRPGNRGIVHHATVFCAPPGVFDFPTLIRGFIVGVTPGDIPLMLPPGVARKIPAGSDIVWQLHYTTTGKEEVDRCQVGFITYKGPWPPVGNAATKDITTYKVAIPPHVANHREESKFVFPRDAMLLSLSPHMHFRGKDFTYTAIFPDGRRETLLTVPRYDFAWQTNYRLAQPKPMPKGTRIECVAHFDNSKANPANPDPSRAVSWGEQSDDEMMIGWIDYYETTANRPVNRLSLKR